MTDATPPADEFTETGEESAETGEELTETDATDEESSNIESRDREPAA
jgi:hypothetical protein